MRLEYTGSIVSRIRSSIQAGVLTISDDFFLMCFYPNGRGDPDNVEKNFLRSGLLVKVKLFCGYIH